MTMPEISRLSDSYNREARLYPALLTLAPIVWTLCALYPTVLTTDLRATIVGAIISLGGLFLLTNLARSRGKAVEQQLNDSWGGWRTTALLRHRDQTIDSHTKARYHRAIENLSSNSLHFPTQAQEAQDPQQADDIYRSGTKLLIESRRDKEKYGLVFKELTAYGFRRNLLGLKTIGISITLAAIFIGAIAWYFTAPLPIEGIHAVLQDLGKRWFIYALLAFDVGYFLVFLLMINRRFVKRSADEYAFSLFRTLEATS